MALGLEGVLGDDLDGGIVVAPHGVCDGTPRIIEVREGGHPCPDAGSVAGANAVLRLLNDLGDGDRVIGLISGGASAMLASPAAGVELQDLQRVTAAVLASGAPIAEINARRRSSSKTAAGGLSAAAHPAEVFVFVVSDVVGDALDVIGSGPFEPTQCRIVLSNEDALRGAAAEAKALGYHVRVVTRGMEGEARQIGARIARRTLDDPGDGPRCLLWGGETTVSLTGRGTGGRNQELALAAAHVLRGSEGVVVLSAGTDGVDGPTDAAGAVVDGATASRVDVSAALLDNDSHPACEAADALVRTGPTGTNVMDIVVGLIR
jgi:hydroxypyruvate reductase